MGIVSRWLTDHPSCCRWLPALAVATYAIVVTSWVSVPTCLLAAMQRPCPTCGTTRSVAAILHCDFAAAWRLNPVGFVVVLVLIRCGLLGMPIGRTTKAIAASRVVELGLLLAFFGAGYLHFMNTL